MRRHDDAVACQERAAAAIETDFWALGTSIRGHEAKDAARRTLERFETVIVAEPDHANALGLGVTALGILREAERARVWIECAQLRDSDNGNLQLNLACSMVSLREHDRAIELLGPVIDTTTGQGLAWMRTDTMLDPIRDDAHYVAFIAAAEARRADSPQRRRRGGQDLRREARTAHSHAQD